VIDSPGGGGKVPLLPEYLESMTDDEVVFRNYEGKRFVYKQPHPVPSTPNEVERAAELNVVPISRKKAATSRRTKRRRAAGE
jgi:lysine 2,3-aminomutase